MSLNATLQFTGWSMTLPDNDPIISEFSTSGMVAAQPKPLPFPGAVEDLVRDALRGLRAWVERAVTVALTVTTVGAPPTLGAFSITPQLPTRVVAPTAVWFNVDLVSLEGIGLVGFDGNPITGPQSGRVYDPRMHELHFKWDFNDPGAVLPAALRLPNQWLEGNTAFGPNVLHTFSGVGTYTPTCTVTDSQGNTSLATVAPISVQDGDSVYTTTRTIYWDPASQWSDAPTGCQQVSNLNAVQNACNAASQPSRLLIARGSDITNVSLDLDGSFVEYFGARGSGAKPRTQNPNTASDKGFNFGSGARPGQSIHQTTFVGFDMRGHWDSTVQGGGGAQALIEPFDVRRVSQNYHVTIHDCGFSGFHWVNIIGDREFDGVSAMTNCTITNWEDYGTFANQVHLGGYNRLAIVGCAIFQDPNALGGDHGKDTRDNEHGPIRIQENQEVYLGVLDLFSRNGWPPANPASSPTPQVQPCIRGNTNGASGHVYNLDRIVGESGAEAVFIFNPENDSKQSLGNNVICDKLLAVGTAQSRTAHFESTFGATTFRNCIGIMPNVPSEYTEDFREAHTCFKCVPSNSGAGNADEPINIHNCTYLNLRDTSNDTGHVPDFARIEGFNDVTDENNVFHAPFMNNAVSAPGSPNTNVATPVPEWTSRFLGLKFTGQSSLQTQFANPSQVPLPVLSSKQAATSGKTAVDDFLANVRPQTNRDVGALETSA